MRALTAGVSLLSWCSADVIKVLLEHGADANAFDQIGNAPLPCHTER